VIIGGPITNNPLHLKKIDADLFVIGEGEATLDELLTLDYLSENFELSSIKGIAYMQSNEVVITQARDYLTSEEISVKYNPSAVRVTDYLGYQASRIYVEVLRGCSNFRRPKIALPDGRKCMECSNCDSENNEDRLSCPEDIPPGCGFCSVPGSWGAPRYRSKKSIVKEIEDLLTLGARRIVLEAPDFLDYERAPYPITNPCSPPANVPAIRDLLESIIDLSWFKDDEAHLSIENIKACLLSEDVAKMLTTTLPSTSPNIGLETGSSLHSNQIGKCGSPEDVLRAIKVARKYGLSPYVYFIYGLPGETAETIEESIRVMKKASEYGASRIILYGFRALPGSAFADFPEPDPDYEYGRKLQDVARTINRQKKEEYVGTSLRAVASEYSWSKKGYTMFYPLGEGPLLTVKGIYSPGTVLSLSITHVLSPGLLLAEVKKQT
jgi:radical SAM superfamily enzyme YgiQ (UPF0313 family)